jgi:hypothetical protein
MKRTRDPVTPLVHPPSPFAAWTCATAAGTRLDAEDRLWGLCPSCQGAKGGRTNLNGSVRSEAGQES